MKTEFLQQGFYLVKQAIPKKQIDSLLQALNPLQKESNHYGVRNLMQRVAEIRDLALSPTLHGLTKTIHGDFSQPVRSIFFDKTSQSNWNVAWHQDTSIALKERHAVPGFDLWSEKQGIPHVEPPQEYLNNMVTLRLHLDRSDKDNGVLRVLPGTHRNGRTSSKQLIKQVEQNESNIVECVAEPGDVLIMSPLLFHSSRKAVQTTHRRIVHIEYCSMQLPPPLQWYEA
ncbi:MAG: phytanoyl-CoA dioxygenase family protein [Gammaproteobacteria bacterium]|nr:phytanoyl-CoA dioxygenase family protein [Gammaproteobacteria bacterium]MDH5801535.1 phytanoyl-CoA dioxygenase family protein [Gammaproteobacteria bacterium]